MKKIIIMMIVFTLSAFAQFNPSRASAVGKYTYVQNYETYAGKDSGTVMAMLTMDVKSFMTLPTGMTGNFNYATKTDTLDGVNDTVEFDFKNQFAFCYVTIRDTGLTTSAGVIDSLVLQIYHPLFNAWSTKAIGLEDISASPAGTIINGDRIVPGTGLIKTYLLRMLYPGKVRVAWVYGANKSGHKTPIIFRGNN